MRTTVKTQEFNPETMYVSKITGEVKRLSKFGMWWRANPEGIFTVGKQSSKSIRVCDI